MKIVIDIPDNKYKWIINNPQIYTDEEHDAIRNGTPLPEHHGRLIDADDFFRMFCELDIEPYTNAPTIIEADTEGSDAE